MKKVFFAMAMVAMMATSCSKDDSLPEGGKGLQKSVTFSLENVVSGVRGVDAMIPEDATKVVLNDCQVFFVAADGSLHTGKDVNGTDNATHYFTTAPTAPITFHFLPAAVEKVVVVGNYGSELAPANLAAIKAIAATAAGQQNDANLLVYGEANLVATTNDIHANTYKAEVSVKPLVARIEIGGFECVFSTTPIYDEVKVTMMALNNYYNDATIGGVLESSYSSATINNSSAYPFFNATTAPTYTKDVISDVSLTPTAPAVDFAADKYLVYHTFAGNVPQLAVRITGVKGNIESPLYLATKAFKDGTNTITSFEPGTIYRMKFNGENRFAFKDEDLDQPEKCVEVSIEAAEWVVVAVTPEF